MLHTESYLDVQVDGNVLWRKYRYVDRGRRLLRVHDVALAVEDALGEYQDAPYYRLIRRREADLDMSLQHNSIQQCPVACSFSPTSYVSVSAVAVATNK